VPSPRVHVEPKRNADGDVGLELGGSRRPCSVYVKRGDMRNWKGLGEGDDR
jgi:hypothetical protein